MNKKPKVINPHMIRVIFLSLILMFRSADSFENRPQDKSISVRNTMAEFYFSSYCLEFRSPKAIAHNKQGWLYVITYF